MTDTNKLSSTFSPSQKWKGINWADCHKAVRNIQLAIVTEYKLGNFSEVRRLQEKLVRSFAARALAVRKIQSNRGGRTAGVDGVVWITDSERGEAVEALGKISSYRAGAVRRMYIPKGNGKEMRPLGILNLFDRAVQALWLFALEPIAETTADTRSYGFRRFRSTKDAVSYLSLLLKSPTGTRKWILDCDIRKFFDSVDHDWLMQNIPIRKSILLQFLKHGIKESGHIQMSEKGFAQGGVISPTLANMTLDGLQALVEPDFRMVRYADNFIVLGKSREALQQILTPIKEFLRERGLELNMDKTKIIHASEGVRYLGYLVKEYPTKSNLSQKTVTSVSPDPVEVKALVKRVASIIKKDWSAGAYQLIQNLNPVLRGWANYYKSSRASLVFKRLAWIVFRAIFRKATRENPRMARRKLARKYFMQVGSRRWIFFGEKAEMVKGNMVIKMAKLYQIGDTPSVVHTLIKGDANPYDPANWEEYFKKRASKLSFLESIRSGVILTLLKRQEGRCPMCDEPILAEEEEMEVHHILPKAKGGEYKPSNLIVLHKICHQQITYTKRAQFVKFSALRKKGLMRMK